MADDIFIPANEVTKIGSYQLDMCDGTGVWLDITVYERNGSKTRKEGGIMKKSVNFNGSKTTQNKKYGTRSAFIKMAKYLGVPNKEIIESVKRAEGHSEPKNHEHDFMSGQCNCGMTETFFKDTPCQK